jgi:hypothetical protein
MIKYDWRAATVVLIPGSVGLVNDRICWRRICKFLKPKEAKNKKQHNFDQKQATNKIKCSMVRIETRNIRNNFLCKLEVNEKF